MSEQQMMRFLFTPGCHSFPPRLPEQHGVRLETAELHRGHPWGKHTFAGIRPPGFLRAVTDNLIVIIAAVGMRAIAWLQQHIAVLIGCWSAINTKCMRLTSMCLESKRQLTKTQLNTKMFSLHFSSTAVKSSLLGHRRLHFSICVMSHIFILQIFFSELTLRVAKGKKKPCQFSFHYLLQERLFIYNDSNFQMKEHSFFGTVKKKLNTKQH